MKDALGYELRSGDIVVCCHSGTTNSTLITAQVDYVTKTSTTVMVIWGGGKVGYGPGLKYGDKKRITVSHRILKLR